MAEIPKYYKIHISGLTVELEPIYTDVAPVVRCKNCWNATKMGGFMGEVLYCPIWERNTDEECFCSHGEQRGGE